MVYSQIEVYFRELLLERGTAVLPGIGTFKLVRQTAKYAENQSSIWPPSHQLKFYPDTLSKEDSLASYIAICDSSLDKDKINGEIDRFIQAIKAGLQNDKEVKFNHIGTLSENELGMNFDADKWVENFYTLGMPTIDVKPLTGRYKTKEDQEVASTATFIDTPKPPPQKSPFLFWLPFLLILTAIAALLFQKSCRENAPQKFPIVVVDSIQNEEVIDTAIKTEKLEEPIAAGEIRQNPDGTYSGTCIVVVGSFKEAKNILRMQDKLEKIGLKVWSQDTDATTRVGFSFSCDSVDLTDHIHKIRKEIDKGAWYFQPQITVN